MRFIVRGSLAARVYGWRAWRPTRLKRTGGLATRCCSRVYHPDTEDEGEARDQTCWLPDLGMQPPGRAPAGDECGERL